MILGKAEEMGRSLSQQCCVKASPSQATELPANCWRMEMTAGRTAAARDGVGDRVASNHALLGLVSNSAKVGDKRCSSTNAGYVLHNDCRAELTGPLKDSNNGEKKHCLTLLLHLCVGESHFPQLLTVPYHL